MIKRHFYRWDDAIHALDGDAEFLRQVVITNGLRLWAEFRDDVAYWTDHDAIFDESNPPPPGASEDHLWEYEAGERGERDKEWRFSIDGWFQLLIVSARAVTSKERPPIHLLVRKPPVGIVGSNYLEQSRVPITSPTASQHEVMRFDYFRVPVILHRPAIKVEDTFVLVSDLEAVLSGDRQKPAGRWPWGEYENDDLRSMADAATNFLPELASGDPKAIDAIVRRIVQYLMSTRDMNETRATRIARVLNPGSAKDSD